MSSRMVKMLTKKLYPSSSLLLQGKMVAPKGPLCRVPVLNQFLLPLPLNLKKGGPKRSPFLRCPILDPFLNQFLLPLPLKLKKGGPKMVRTDGRTDGRTYMDFLGPPCTKAPSGQKLTINRPFERSSTNAGHIRDVRYFWIRKIYCTCNELELRCVGYQTRTDRTSSMITGTTESEFISGMPAGVKRFSPPPYSPLTPKALSSAEAPRVAPKSRPTVRCTRRFTALAVL